MDNKDDYKDNLSESKESTFDHSPTRWRKSINSVELAPDPIVLNRIIDLLVDKNVRISKVSEMILKDPVTTLEILSRANSGDFANEKSRISAIHTAVVRIGSEELLKLCRVLYERSIDLSPNIATEMNQLRALSCRAALVAEILSSNLQRDIIEVAQTCALLSYYGLMLACYSLQEDFLELTHIKKRSTLTYRLLSNFSFDVNKVQIDYFQKRNLPSLVFFAFDKELKCKTSAQSSLRFIVESALEIAEALDEDKIDKYKYFHRLPAKSSLRLLKINEHVYENIFSDIEDALGLSGDRDKIIAKEEDDNSSQDSFNALIEDTLTLNRFDVAEEAKELEDNNKTPTLVINRVDLVNYITKSGSAVFIEKASDTIEQERAELSSSSDAIIGLLQTICQNAKSAQELLNDLMEVVTEKGPFSRTAVIELTEGRREAFVHTALGEDFDNLKANEAIKVFDPLSPLSTVVTKVQSFNAKSLEDHVSPFGVTSYAVSPIKTTSKSQLVFYADCGTEKPLPFEARKVFRLAVALLNDTLPKLDIESKKK